MANIIVVTEKNAGEIFAKHDPYNWKYDLCGKEKIYTKKEIDKKKKPWPDPENHYMDYYITCPFCSRGEMEPPTFVSFGGFLKGIIND